ncbi:Inactive N-acetylated-alpha-linked acidic dipeptidase-like protein 2, partial [Varanus komodoensis]
MRSTQLPQSPEIALPLADFEDGKHALSLLEEAGFGGVLIYIDPCDLPKTQNLSSTAFMVSLNSGGDPSSPGYPSI